MAEHSPLPWRIYKDDDLVIVFGDGDSVCDCAPGNPFISMAAARANTAFIVKAVNNHEALVKALTDALCELSHCATQLAARGLPGRDGDSVSRAQHAARDILSRVGGSGT